MSGHGSGHRPMPPPPPSHASFILAQVRSGLAHLHAVQALDKDTFNKVNDLLGKAVLQESPSNSESTTLPKAHETEEERLGKRNAWLRETLIETSLLPTLVETAMQIAIPSALMGSAQREAVVLLVERSQKSIVDSVTNPTNQKKASSGAWSGVRGTHAGIRKGWNAAGNSIQEISQRRQEAKEKSDEKKAAKKEKKAMKKELKREREEIIKQRQTEMLNDGNQDQTTSQQNLDRMTSARNLVHSPSALTAASDGSSSAHRLPPIASSSIHGKTGEDSDDDDDDSSSDEEDEEEGFFAEDGAMASVSCGRIDDEENGVTATTTFSPWPGLLLSSTIVALSQDQLPKSVDIERIRLDQARENDKKMSASSAPPPRRVAPASSSSRESQPATQLPSSGETLNKHDLPPIPSERSTPVQRTPAPPLPPQSPSATHIAPPIPSTQNVPTRRSNESRMPPTQPSHTSSTPQQPQQNEVRDVTESKQKSWTRKLGL